VAFFDQYPQFQEFGKSISNRLRPFLKRRIISLTLIVAGVLLLGYVGGEYWATYRSQKNLEAAWQSQAATFNASSQTHQVSISPEQMLTRLVVTKIGIDAIVVEGASRKDLSEGPGHMKQTAEPGETGNAVVTGHRDTFFRHIHELAKGDQIQVQRNGRIFVYEVTGRRIVMPEDISVINPTKDAELTLITCYPTYYIGPAPKRLVVFSRLIESDGQPVNQAQATQPVEAPGANQ
jgi:LPXTG-site transpeptidase (sortase) family protein